MAYKVLVFVALATAAQTQGGRPPLDVAAVLDRWDAGSRLIESYDLTVDLEIRSYLYQKDGIERLTLPGETYPPSFDHSHIFKKAGKRLGEFAGSGAGDYGTKLLFDGQVSIAAEIARNVYSLRSGCQVFGNSYYEDYDVLYRTVLGSTDRIAMSRERQARLLPREGSIYVISVPPAKQGDFQTLSWKVWLDPAKNFLPSRWTETSIIDGREVRNRDCDVVLKEVAEGVWAPVEANMTVYNQNLQSPVFGKVIGHNMLKVNLEKSHFNVPIADEIFDVKIPDGATVVDNIRNVVYTKGSSDPDGYLDRLAARGRKDRDAIPPTDGPPSQIFVPTNSSPGRSRWITAAGGLAVIAVIVVAVIGFRRLSGRRS
jgi:hypothetical protein